MGLEIVNLPRLDITLRADPWEIPRFGLDHGSVRVPDCSYIGMALWVRIPGGLWQTGVEKEVTHQALCLSSFFNSLSKGVVMTCLQILLGELLAHALHSFNTPIRFSSYFYILLFGLSNVSTTLTFWEIL